MTHLESRAVANTTALHSKDMVISSPVHPECETMLDAYLASLSSLLGQRQQNGATSGPSQEKQGLSNAAPSPKKTNRARAQHVQVSEKRSAPFLISPLGWTCRGWHMDMLM